MYTHIRIYIYIYVSKTIYIYIYIYIYKVITIYKSYNRIITQNMLLVV